MSPSVSQTGCIYVLGKKYIYTYVYAITIPGKWVINLKESKKEYIGGFGRKTWREKMIKLHDNIKIKRNRKNKKDSKEINQLNIRYYSLMLALLLFYVLLWVEDVIVKSLNSGHFCYSGEYSSTTLTEYEHMRYSVRGAATRLALVRPTCQSFFQCAI